MRLLNKEQTLALFQESSLHGIARFQTDSRSWSLITTGDKLFIVQYNADLLRFSDAPAGEHIATLVERCDYPVDDDDETFQKELEFFGRFVAQSI